MQSRSKDKPIHGKKPIKSEGTAHTVDYTLKQNKIVIQFDPETSSVSMLSKRNFESV